MKWVISVLIVILAACQPTSVRADQSKEAIIFLHGLYQTPESGLKMSNLQELRQRGVLVVALDGHGSWNAGRCCGPAMRDNRDDMLTIYNAVKNLRDQGYRVNLVGFSNGGMMAYRYACEHGGVDSVTTVAGSLSTHFCGKRFRVLHIHGTSDNTVPYRGGYSSFTGTSFLSVASEPGRASNAVVVISTHPGGHVWPAGTNDKIYNWIERR